MSKQPVIFCDLGNMEYQQAWDLQEQLLARNVRVKSQKWHGPEQSVPPIGRRPTEAADISTAAGDIPAIAGNAIREDDMLADTVHHLLFVEHPPVYTLGKSGKIEHVLISDEERLKNNMAFFRINRGGDITFHGPGQLVAYPIFDLEKFYTDIGKYLRNLEEVIIRTLSDYGIVAGRSPGETGVWLDPGQRGRERKICAIGIRSSRWITMHGLAFNVNTNLDYFNNIVPCGIPDKQVTSLARELSREVEMDEVKTVVKKYFSEVFDVELIEEQL